ncbi:MAG: LysR family transcriptional regulator [Thiotrichales bacterium]|jgi:LysR family transcriptional regulator for metE and metH|nr:LysR family transcriptional regulator [Thiotrichales bacterium]
MIELQQLLMLQTIAACEGNLTQAARRLHLSQPAISKQVKQLETSLNMPLIDRDKRPARFTPAGNALLQLAAQVLPLVAQTERQLAQLQEADQQQLRVALECDICYDWLMPAMTAYQPLWPRVEMDLVTGEQASPQRLIDGDSADFVLATQVPEVAHLSAHALFDYQLLAVMPKVHPLAAKAYVVAEDFSEVCLLHFPRPRKELDIFRRVLMPAKIEPSSTRTHHLAAGILQLVAAGKGVAAMPSWALKQLPTQFPVLLKPIGAQGTWITMYGITQAAKSGKAWVRDFVKLIREQNQQ